MKPSQPIRFEFETRPADWNFPGGEAWIAGWLEGDGDDGPLDVRAWVDGVIFMGLIGLPEEPVNPSKANHQRFTFLLNVSHGCRHLRLEVWCARCGWNGFFETDITVASSTVTVPREISQGWLTQMPRFARAWDQGNRGPYESWADEVVRSAAAKPLNVLPAPPFVGALETPADDGYVREDRLLVSGWLAHGAQLIRKVVARSGVGPEATLAYGLQRRDVGEQFPDLPNGSYSHFVGLVELPRGLPEPALLLIFAELDSGERCLVFARRFLPWKRDGVDDTAEDLVRISALGRGDCPQSPSERRGRLRATAPTDRPSDKSAISGAWCSPLRERRDDCVRSQNPCAPAQGHKAWDSFGLRYFEGPDFRRLRSAWALLLAARRHGVSWWDFANFMEAARAPWKTPQAARLAAEGAFAESTPLSLFLSSLEDHEVRSEPEPARVAVARDDALNVLFVLHCDFSCASALHVLALARELTQQGQACIAAVPERLDTLDDHESPGCRGILHADVLLGISFPDGRGPDVVHAWSTRESVRLVVEHLRLAHPQLTLIVHLEDNDQRILSETLRRPLADLLVLPPLELDRLVTPDLSHPRRAPEFLESAHGVTVVVDRLASFVPDGIPVQLITPAADRRYFYPRPRQEDFRALIDRRSDTTILFYHGNVHPSNVAEVRELYAAVLQLNRVGVPVRLIRTGNSPAGFLGAMANEVTPFVRDLGRIARHRHLGPLLALADIFVQPGWDDEFNAFRVPSKLPEFFSVGRPVILPRTNLGLVARHGEDAFVLDRADCASIVEAVRTLRADRVLYERLAKGATIFAAAHFSWERSAAELAIFYASLLTEASTPPR